MVGVEEGHKFRFRRDLYSQESTFPLVQFCGLFTTAEIVSHVAHKPLVILCVHYVFKHTYIQGGPKKGATDR